MQKNTQWNVNHTVLHQSVWVKQPNVQYCAIKVTSQKGKHGFSMHATDFLKINNYLEISLLLQPFLRPFILIIISAVNWPVTFIYTLLGCTFFFTALSSDDLYYTLSKSSTVLYGFLYPVLHWFYHFSLTQNILSMQNCPVLATIHLWSPCKFSN